MPKKTFLILIFQTCLLYAEPALISQNDEEIDELNAYDPFTDYIDFQDTEGEEEDMAFFKTGKMLSAGIFGGYRHFIFPPNEERNTSNSINYGLFLKNFANLHIATQFSYTGSINSFAYTHNNQLLSARTIYHHLGMEFRYYWNRSQLVRPLARLNPYISAGGFMTLRSSQRYVSRQVVPQSNYSAGVKGGLGLEIHLSTRVYLGLNAEYNFMFIAREECVTSSNQYICAPENMVNTMLVLGRNF